MNLGRAIRVCRLQKQMKQADLAQRANISVSFLSLIEQGRRDPNFLTVKDIATALEVPMSVLVFLAGEDKEFAEFSPELADKISLLAFRLLGESIRGNPSV